MGHRAAMSAPRAAAQLFRMAVSLEYFIPSATTRPGTAQRAIPTIAVHISRGTSGERVGERGKSNKTKRLSPTYNNRTHSLTLPVRRVRAKPPECLRRRKDQGRWGQRPSPLGGILSSASHYFSSRRANEQLLLLRRKRGRGPLPFRMPICLI